MSPYSRYEKYLPKVPHYFHNIMILTREFSDAPRPDVRVHSAPYIRPDMTRGPADQPVTSPSASDSSVNRQNGALENPLDGESPFKCALCGEKSSRSWDLTRHYRRRHPDYPLPQVSRPRKPRDPGVTCPLCYHHFKRTRDLGRHYDAVHLNERPAIEPRALDISSPGESLFLSG